MTPSGGFVRRWGARLQAAGPTLGLVSLLAVFAVLLADRGQLGNFLSWSNIQVLLHSNSVIAVAALGMLLVIINGGIDLSVGSIMALVTVVTAQVYLLVYYGPVGTLSPGAVEELTRLGLLWQETRSTTAASLAAVTAGLTAGFLCGLVNGLVVTRLNVTPFVATLGMLWFARGLAVWLAARTLVPIRGERPLWVEALSKTSSDLFGLDPGVWSVVLLAVIVAVLLHRTVFGRYCYAVGANEATARMCGIRVERHKARVYALSGLLTGWAGILLFAQTSGGNPNGAVGTELEVIAAVVLGGASLAGGRGGVVGTMVGVLILGILDNCLPFFNVTIEVKYIFLGVIVVTHMALRSWRRGREERA